MSSATVTDKVHGEQSADGEFPGGESAAALLTVLNDALDRLGAQVLDGATDDAALRSSIVALHRVESRVHAEKLRRLAELDARRAYYGDAAMTTTAWAKTRLGLTRGEAATLAKTAVGLEALPETARALRDGEIGVGQAQTAVRASDDLDAHAERSSGSRADTTPNSHDDSGGDDSLGGAGNEGDDKATSGETGETGAQASGAEDGDGDGQADDQGGQQRLREQLDALAAKSGREQDRSRLRQGLDAWANRHRPGRLADREHQAFLNRWLRLGAEPGADGTVHIEGCLDPLGAAHVRAALDALARPCGDGRSYPQRLADALTTICRNSRDDGGLPDVAAQRPHILLITQPGQPNTHDSPNGAGASNGAASATESAANAAGAERLWASLDGYGPVSQATARLVGCDAETTTVTVNGDGETLNVGRARRDPNRAQRAAVIARDQHCVGCHAPATRCQVHHVHWWRHGGPTDLDNLVLACWSCHHHLHHAGWQITRRGTTYTAHPPDRPPDG
ncbi:MAG: DUF222 domain-containing protein [Egibacteraceae bacterium]